ncbi:hypothetical protein GCM10009740_31270 [Terrabacter terrae]|uniref:Holin n=1 Tax=Terrabacter terrae TaxID=318434 RepID=A0ABP5G327_9MICO
MLTQLVPSIIRTVVPLLVALVTALLVKAGIDPGPFHDLIAQLCGALVATAYYVAVRVFETHVKPHLGWFLGYPKQPSYDPPAASETSPTGAVATEGTTGIPAGEPVDVVPLGDSAGDAAASVKAGIESIAQDALPQPVADPLPQGTHGE